MERNNQRNSYGHDCHTQLFRPVLKRTRNPLLFNGTLRTPVFFKGQYDFFYHACECIYKASAQGFFDINVFLSFTAQPFALRNYYADRFAELYNSHGALAHEWHRCTQHEAEQQMLDLLKAILEACNVRDFPSWSERGHAQFLDTDKMLDAVHQFVCFDLIVHIAERYYKGQN